MIVNTSSEQASDPSEDLVDYALTRAAVLNFTKSMAKQLAPKGIRVNAVAPGPFWTPLQISGGATPEKLQKFGSQSPLGRPGQVAGARELTGRAPSDSCVNWRRVRIRLTAPPHSLAIRVTDLTPAPECAQFGALTRPARR